MNPLPAQLLSLSRLGRFLAVGGLGAVCDNALLALLHGGLGVALLPAKLVGAEASILLMFAVNERWTFSGYGAGDREAVVRRLVSSHGVRLVGLAVGIVVLVASTDWVGLWYLAANVLSLGAGFVSNYCFESVVTWQVR